VIGHAIGNTTSSKVLRKPRNKLSQRD